ncbi:hypothetical protein Q5762_32620 [Streptomyces sp. P9(2023)]|uniref:hypothetical protein n=1 Tax=Streptomyces sp. P9(2023) TaxID=3064394 RepID=UPI0028F3F29B|nr:hypothetical protein [Streptomyces sp. P9(2023)]MDT9692984.1 hypothetical protein [Streptomyces sp. P9(2023)]
MNERHHRLRGAGTGQDTLLLYTLMPLGLILFALGILGATTGITLLPFDPHHVITQIGGLVLAFIGLRHWK